MGLSVLVSGSPSAGSLAGTDRLDNFPSFLGLGNGGGGQGWVDTAVEQASSFGAEFAPPSVLAAGLAKTNGVFEVQLGDATHTKVHAKTVIVASGSTPRRLNLPHEQILWGHSLHSCALCDGDLYARGKRGVAVIGGGDAAVEAVSLLHKMGVASIHWIHRREEYRASALEVKRVKQLPNVDVWTPFVVVEWMTKETGLLEGVRIVGAKDGVADPEAASSLTIPVDGAFLMIGSTPNSDWLQSSGMDIDPSTKLVRIASSQDGASSGGNNNPLPQFSTATSINGAFAAGELVDEVYRQALTASSEGAKAAIDGQRYLRHMGMETSASAKARLDVGKREPAALQPSEDDKKSKGPVDCDLTKAECIQSVVSSHPVVVFSKYYCPHCRRALEALRAFTYKSADLPLVLDLTNIKGGFQAQDTLASMTGRRTVPNVFVGGKSIGGGDETTALHREGKLEGMLRDAGAI
ncbi:hypothetical protein ACHAXT_007075 [Thalassiosira profunda]